MFKVSGKAERSQQLPEVVADPDPSGTDSVAISWRPLRHERPATATMFATEHARAAPKPSGWRVAVVVLRYFVAVRLAGHLAFEHQLQRGLSTCVRFTVNVGVSGLVVAQHL